MVGRRLKSLPRDTRGGVAVLFSLAVLPLIIAAGVALDYANLSRADARLANGADSAALAGAKAMVLAFELPEAERRVAAESVAQKTVASLAPTALAAISASVAESSVAVTLTEDEPLLLLRFIGEATKPVGAQSVAIFTPNEPIPCLLALSPSAPSGISVDGSATVTGPKCMAWSNSTSPSSLSFTGASDTSAQRICAVGGKTGSASVSPSPETSCDPFADPYASRSTTDGRTCDHGTLSVEASQTVTLDPGVYCGDFVLKGDVTLSPGLFVIRDGVFRVEGAAQVQGTGVSFLLVGNSYLDWAGRAVIDISAMSTGELAGIAIASDRGGPALSSTISGNVPPLTAGVAGSIYLPNQTLSMSGSSEVRVAAGSGIITNSVLVTGSGTLRLDYDDEAVRLAALNTLHLMK